MKISLKKALYLARIFNYLSYEKTVDFWPCSKFDGGM